MKSIEKYLDDCKRQLATGNAREHAYRPALKNLLEEVIPDITATNDPARIDCGAPDFILSRRKIDVGYIEAKDIGVDLGRIEKDEQLGRYLASLDNLILTDYLQFRFYRNGEKVDEATIAELGPDGKIISMPENFEHLKTLLLDFSAFQGQTIKSARKLAGMMARKAQLMRNVFSRALQDTDSTLHEQFRAFKTILVHDMDESQFADVYAQTIAFGLFTARLHDTTLVDFSRAEAQNLIPKSNPFLRQLFIYMAGPDLDDRVVWIVDALCEVYRAADLQAILKDFGTATGRNDPILHFYETFLAEYDSKLRKSRGVWYTPEPVVGFIVRAVDEVLKTHFGLEKGLADTSQTTIQLETSGKKKGRTTYEAQVHKVQLLDVATGTGTFLAEVVKQVYGGFAGQEGLWSAYVERDLLPRMHGFELLIASYAMCHMKLDLLLHETGYRPSNPANPPRLGVYLTNSLEEHHPDTDTLFAQWLSREANEASRIKKEMPIMVAMGNPPYSGHSSNKGEWITKLLDAYKKEPGGRVKLKERNGKWLNDDYVKFIRLGEHYIAKNGEGALAYITNHSYLDNPTFRGMRWHLLSTFDDIYILDLHGNSKKKEKAPDGKADKNVFDIQQGVAIIIAVKKSGQGKKPLATLHHADLWGERQAKYDFLEKHGLADAGFKLINPAEQDYFFIPRNNDLLKEYRKGFALNELFPVNSVGIVTARDALTIHEKREKLLETIKHFSELPPEQARQEYDLRKDTRDWKVALAQEELRATRLDPANITPITYRPFDNRWTYYTGKSKGFHCMPRGEVMQHFFKGGNVGLITARSNKTGRNDHFFVSKNISEAKTGESSTQSSIFPLYIYESTLEGVDRKLPNLEPKLYADIRKAIPDATPESLFDYIYAVLHSPEYRKRYAEFLKSDFPRIPWPKDAGTFHALAALGARLRAMHLMESDCLNTLMTTYPVDGSHEVKTLEWKASPDNPAIGKVSINETQFFGNVPKLAWEFFIGGYQPAQKWLKDRKGHKLTIEDIRHWQRIIVALAKTGGLMQEIGKIDFLPKS